MGIIFLYSLATTNKSEQGRINQVSLFLLQRYLASMIFLAGKAMNPLKDSQR